LFICTKLDLKKKIKKKISINQSINKKHLKHTSGQQQQTMTIEKE
jgi:hypothetical protein